MAIEDFIKHEQELEGIAERDAMKHFHEEEKRSAQEYCEKRGKKCENCVISCEYRENSKKDEKKEG